MLSGIPLSPEQASTLAPQVDALYFFVLAVTAFFAILVVVFVVIFAVKYRDRTGERLGAPIHGSIFLELGWSIIPFLIAMVIFVWATVMFFQIVRPSAETLEIYSTASAGYGGSSTSTARARSTSCTVPRGRPIRVTFTSEDVLHSLCFRASGSRPTRSAGKGEKTSTSRYVTLGGLAAYDNLWADFETQWCSLLRNIDCLTSIE